MVSSYNETQHETNFSIALEMLAMMNHASALVRRCFGQKFQSNFRSTNRDARCNALCFTVLLALFSVPSSIAAKPQDPDSALSKKLRVLLVTSGCCHDYDFQTLQIQKAFDASNVECDWTVVAEGGKGTKAQISLYDNEDWADSFDLVIHNECFADTKDNDYIARIANGHRRGTPAIVIHCAMHTYRNADTDQWREFLGVTSRHHEHQSNYPVEVLEPQHPIMADFPADWMSPKDELYVIETVWPNTVPLAVATSERDQRQHACFWINQFGDARVFGTTFGHSNETFENEVFLRALVRGGLWAANRLDD